jgi:LemA protein
MSEWGPLPLAVTGLGATLAAGGVVAYNRLVTLRNRYRNAFSQIDVQLKRRYDLIPNLVATAKGYLQHERELLEHVADARTRALTANARAVSSPGEPQAMKELSGAESAFGGAIGRLMAVAEGYPTLKASENMLRLMEDLASTENRIAFARQAFNDAVMGYNTARERFPAAIVANAAGFAAAEYFELTSAVERETPRVAFG